MKKLLIIEKKLKTMPLYHAYYIEYGGDEINRNYSDMAGYDCMIIIVQFYFKDPFSKDYNREWGFELNRDDNMEWEVVNFGEGF